MTEDNTSLPTDLGPEPTGTEVLGGSPATKAPLTRLKLLVLTGRSAGKELLLRPGTLFVGKGSDCDLVLDDSSVSRMHLEVAQVEDGRVRLKDLDSTNGSACDGTRFHEVDAQPGAVLTLGKTELRLVAATAPGPAFLPSERESFGRLAGKSLIMRQVFAVLERVAASDAAVLLEGETGTGKDLCAEALHQHSPRSGKPFVIVDLAGVQPNLIESELFGHVRGSFTGSVGDRAGAFERADGGTIFLDEVAELSPDLQPRLLRALEHRQAKRVGANDYKGFDVRVIAATNRDLVEEVRAGRFREDLYHRLGVVKVTLPPLRARREDVPLLVERILESMGREAQLGPGTLQLLQGYEWPGNVRELRNVVERAVSLGGPEGEVPAELLALQTAAPKSDLPISDLPFKEAKERLVGSFERDYLVHLLERCGGNVSKAARHAGIDRVYLHRLLKKHGIG
ncbi:MAG: sigma 54-dependent Fis family transcriptional regulator [Myxococcales bacterium]